MTLIDAYQRVKPGIVAFAPVYDRREADQPRAAFPGIFGTGFVIREDGIIATNQHVVELFGKFDKPKGAETSSVMAMLFRQSSNAIITIPLEVIATTGVKSFTPGPAFYGDGSPDVAFVRVKACGLPALELDSTTIVQEGLEVATAGFPMGIDHMKNARGKMAQIGPTLQRGIISGVWPAPCAVPDGYIVNVMVQGGASGSPVFDTNTGKVLGIVHSRRLDSHLNQGGVPVPTNFSLVAPSHYLSHFLSEMDSLKNGDLPADTQTLESIVASRMGGAPPHSV